MNKPIALLLVALGLTAGEARADTLLTFDDLNVATEGSIPFGYGGLYWNSFQLMNTNWFLSNSGANGYTNGTVSAPNVAWVPETGALSGIATANLSSPTPFDLNSVELTAAWNDNLSIQVQGYLNGQLVDSKTVQVSTTGPTLVNFDYENINALTFTAWGGTFNSSLSGSSSGGPQFVLDNFDFTKVAPVPEPTSFAVALLGVGYAWRKRRSLQLGRS